MTKALRLPTTLAAFALTALTALAVVPAVNAQTSAASAAGGGTETGSAAPSSASGPSPTASPRAADKLVAMCVGCHNIPGYQASFPQVHKVPMIAGQSAKYIAAALNEYKKGDRKHPTMRGIAASLSDQDIASISTYYEELGGKAASAPVPDTLTPPPSAEVQALLTKGNCVSCHGANLNKPLDPSYPKLSGQYHDYLFVALKAYQTEGNPRVGRNNAIMAAQAKQFTHAELKLLADYIGSLPAELKTVPESRFR